MSRIITTIIISVFILVFFMSRGVIAESMGQIQATVTMIDGDTQPATTPGPGSIDGDVALDYNYRSIFVTLEEPTIVSNIILKSDPFLHAGASNVNLTAGRLELYYSNDNVNFKKVNFKYSTPDNNTIVLDGLQGEAKYLKIHTTCDQGTNYKFVNNLKKMVPTFVPPPLKGGNYYELEDPLFESLLSDVPGPNRVLDWAGNCDDELGRVRPWFRAHAKKFGYRYVFEEQLQEAARHNLVESGKRRPELDKHGIVTWRNIIGDPGEAYVPSIDGMPMVFGTQGWLMDPRWMNSYFKRAVERAEAKEQWALSTGDETWEVFAINAVPKDNRYDYVIKADEEIREKYGFGKYGMPDSNDDPNPFARIAHRRWVSDKLTELFKKTYEAVKKVNPDTVMLSPDFASGVPAADVEAWAPYFDIFTAQCATSPSPFVNRFAVGCDTKVLADLTGKPAWMAVQNATPANAGYTVTPEHVREMYSQVFRNGGQGIFLMASEWWEREFSHPKYAEPAKWRAMLHVVDTITNMNLPKLPEADSAILYSSDSLLTLRFAQMNNGERELYSAYTVLGPLLRSWFHFVSDRQIERGIRNLSNYKVLYIPFAEYERRSVLDKIETYVKAGGTVVCTDPEAFSWDISGESLVHEWEKISGVRKEKRENTNLSIKTVKLNPLGLEKPISFSLLGPGYKIVPLDEKVKPIAIFEDGTPAITLHPYGKGKVIFFAAEPFAVRGQELLVGQTSGLGRPYLSDVREEKLMVEQSAPLVSLIKEIQKTAGAKLGHDIWRFKLPPFPSDVYQKEKGICLTGNYVYDRNEPLQEKNNIQTAGTYTYSRLPTGVPDSGKIGEPILFTEGHLTNRLKAYQNRVLGMGWNVSRTADIPIEWIVSWTDPAPVTVTFDLKSEYLLNKARLFYSGTLPALEVSGSLDGSRWQTMSSIPEESADEDIKDVTLTLEGKYRYVNLDFAARVKGEKFELCETEIWTDQVK